MIRRLPGASIAQLPAAEARATMLREMTPAPDRVLVVTVHELGPVIQILGPMAALGGGTEVVLQFKGRDPRSGESIAKTRTHWRHGGSFVFKGTRTLPQDMRSALQATLHASIRPR